MVIVYRSNTGFTMEYALMLGKAEKVKAFSVPEAEERVSPEEPVLYMAPLMAGHITGLGQAVKGYALKGVCGVGMSPPSRQTLETLSRANPVPNIPIFYLQGGWAPQKVGWLKRRMVHMVTRSTRQALGEKGSRRTPEEEAQYQLLVRGGSCVAFENLGSLRRWLKEQA